jgi:CHAT domain-containing protein
VPANQRTHDPARLEQELDALQKQMKQRLVNLGTPVNMILAEENAFLQVKNALKPHEAAIEFLSFNYYDITRETDSILYCALVLRPEYQFPKMVFLTLGSELEPLIDQHPDQLYGKGNIELFKKIIVPLAPYLDGIKTLYYSPAGLLHRFSFSAIPLPGGEVLSDRYLLHNLASTRNINAEHRPFSGQTGMLYGGIDYNTDATTLARLSGNYQYEVLADASLAGATRHFRGSEWTYLPGTRAEAEQISQLLTRGRIYSLTLTGQEATEESCKSLSGKSPSIIHIASHGFSFPPEDKDDFRREMMDSRSLQTFTIADHPLMRSGLVFSGANNTWARGNPPPGIEDGILTAYELANLDLSSTRLVVLSACETGLGDIKGNEGVFGLQRALFMAGVQSMVVSLWEVPDMETMELMTLFYGHLVDGKPLYSAFQLAKEEMKSRYPEQPSLWAGFVLIR